MLRLRALITTLLACATVSCGGDGTGPSSSYNVIAGTYDGVMGGTSQGVTMNATFSLTITQNGGTLGGSWALQGTLRDGIDVLNIQGTGSTTGTIASGNNPSVNFVIKTGTCPNYQVNFSGAFDTANQRLTISGPIEFFAAGTCNVILSYQMTIFLSR